MRTGLTISTGVHILVLVCLLVLWWLPVTKMEPTEALAVDVVSDTEFSTMVAGIKNAPQSPVAKPVVDKIGEAKPVKDPTLKVSDKPEIAPSAELPPPPAPQPDKPEVKPEKAEPKPEKAEAKPEKVEPQPDEIAEAIKRDEEKKREEAKKLAEQKKRDEAKKLAEAKKREEARKRAEAEKFDTGAIDNRLALLDKRAPQRQAATGETLNQTATLGAAVATGPTLSVNELQALQAHLADCWEVPVGVRNARDLSVIVRIEFKRDGSLAAEPVVMNRSAQPVFQVAAESAQRAVRKCAPYTFMPVAKYDAWKVIEVDFDPKQMFGL
jgi:colicin import membrane protein